MTTTTTGAGLDHVIGANGLLSIRLRDGRARLRAVDGDSLRIRDGHGRDLADMFAIELGEGSASFQADKRWDGGRHGRSHTPDLEIDLPRGATLVIEAGSADIEADGLAGDQRYRTASGDMTLRAVSGRVAVDAVSGDVDISAIGEAAVTIRTVSGDVELRASDPDRARRDDDERRPQDRRPARRSGPVRDRDGQRRHAPRPGRRRPDRDGDAVGRHPLRGRWPDRRRPRTPVAGGRAGGPLVSFRSLSGDLLVVPPTPVQLPARRARRPGAASSSARHPSPPSRPPVPRTAPSPPPMTTRGCASCARSSAARSTSPRPASDSRRSMASTRSMTPNRRTHPQPRPPPGRRPTRTTAPRPPGSTRPPRRCLTTPSSGSSGSSPRVG